MTDRPHGAQAHAWWPTVVATAALFWIVPETPLRHLDDPSHWGLLGYGGLLVVATLRWWRGSDPLPRTTLALFLVAMPCVYLANWLRFGGAPGWLAVEASGLLLFAGAAWCGLRGRPGWLIGGIAGHGLWDVAHLGATPFVPDWYATACACIDLGLAGTVAALGVAPSPAAAAAGRRAETERRAGATPGDARVSVRPVDPGDAECWHRMRCELWPGSDAEHRREIDVYLAGGATEPAEVLVAAGPEGLLQGFAELSIRACAEGCRSQGVAYLEGWFVAAPYRRRGVGRALIRAAEEWGRQRGCLEIASDAHPDNAVSVAAHLAVGFDDAGPVRCFRRDL